LCPSRATSSALHRLSNPSNPSSPQAWMSAAMGTSGNQFADCGSEKGWGVVSRQGMTNKSNWEKHRRLLFEHLVWVLQLPEQGQRCFVIAGALQLVLEFLLLRLDMVLVAKGIQNPPQPAGP